MHAINSHSILKSHYSIQNLRLCAVKAAMTKTDKVPDNTTETFTER